MCNIYIILLNTQCNIYILYIHVYMHSCTGHYKCTSLLSLSFLSSLSPSLPKYPFTKAKKLISINYYTSNNQQPSNYHSEETTCTLNESHCLTVIFLGGRQKMTKVSLKNYATLLFNRITIRVSNIQILLL